MRAHWFNLSTWLDLGNIRGQVLACNPLVQPSLTSKSGPKCQQLFRALPAGDLTIHRTTYDHPPLRMPEGSGEHRSLQIIEPAGVKRKSFTNAFSHSYHRDPSFLESSVVATANLFRLLRRHTVLLPSGQPQNILTLLQLYLQPCFQNPTLLQ